VSEKMMARLTAVQSRPPRSGQGRDVQVGEVGEVGDDERRRVDAELALRAVNDATAFAELYDRYVDSIYRYCYRRTGNREHAEDVTSAIFLRTLESIPDFRGGSFRAWLFAIAHNVLINMGRRPPETQLPSDFDTADSMPTPEEFAIATTSSDSVSDILQRLPEAQRHVIELRLAGLSGSEIAEAMGRSVAAIKMLQLRAMKRLREQLEHQSRDRR
jgi:RNA polymerase sigma-70 factor (ECF subfamily)